MDADRGPQHDPTVDDGAVSTEKGTTFDLSACNLLERAIAAIWRAHGDAMADLLACCDPDDAISCDPADIPVRSDTPRADDELF